MSKILDKNQYYKITFGMQRDAMGKPFFEDTLYVGEGDGCIGFSVYAKMDKGILKELVTDSPIPIKRSKRIPGFGAYSIMPIFTFEDLRALSLQMRWISEGFYDPYIQALKAKIKKLTEAEEQYLSETSDDLGPLNVFQSHRDDELMSSCELETATISSLVEMVSKKTK